MRTGEEGTRALAFSAAQSARQGGRVQNARALQLPSGNLISTKGVGENSMPGPPCVDLYASIHVESPVWPPLLGEKGFLSAGARPPCRSCFVSLFLIVWGALSASACTDGSVFSAGS
ncbi:unnamed protein product [Effrenium voratum]|nr:unnamed protein product [Effrenium voratum]CAJ1460727.1 unnamed protein product [Effrenium voratum]